MVDRSAHPFGLIVLFGILMGGCASDGTTTSSTSANMGSAPTNEMVKPSNTGSSSNAGTVAATSTATASSSGMTSSSKNIDRIAQGSVEDSLDSCMSRIPKDASAGQRMLAEESCRRDQANRR